MCQQTQPGECLICADCHAPILGEVFYFFGQPMDKGCFVELRAEYREEEEEYDLIQEQIDYNQMDDVFRLY